MSKIAIIGEIKGKITGSGYRELIQTLRTVADVWTNYTGTAMAVAKQLIQNGEETVMISAVGNDFIGKAIKADLEEKGVDTQFLKIVEDKPTAMEIETLNILGDLDYYIVGNSVNAAIDVDHVKGALDVINGCDMAVIDASLSEDVLKFVAENVTITKFFDPGNEEDALKAKEIIGKFDIIKPNRAEAAVLFGKDIYSEEELNAAVSYFEEQGVGKIFVTMSGGGVHYKSSEETGTIRPEKVVPFVRKDGAGNAFSAAIVDGTVKGMSMEEIANYGMEEAAKIIEKKVSYDPSELLWGEPQ